MAQFLDRLIESSPEIAAADLPEKASERVEKLARTSRIYSQLLLQNPGWLPWLESPEAQPGGMDFPALNAEWRRFRLENENPARNDSDYLSLLRRFRRRISLRIAYQSLAGLTAESATVRELTQLADFCVRECYFISLDQWTSRLGQPWDESENGPARFCCIALGKLGGRELNFSSDVDLLYLFEGDGNTRIDGERTSMTNNEFFHRLGEGITRSLNQQDAGGFLFRTDLRLRPGGDGSPLVPSLEAMENYYALAGQTWERLALLKARPIAGDFSLGGELLESLQSFRYPRHPPPSILADVALMKVRTENEVVGSDAVSRDVKSGYGGIREIEFIVQASQLLHGARFPFLQTNSTTEALQQLVRYGLLPAVAATLLENAYWFLRRVEHRLQMVNEQQTHELPADDSLRLVIADSMNFDSLGEFDLEVARVRKQVRESYEHTFETAPDFDSDMVAEWWELFANGKTSRRIEGKLRLWFRDEPEPDQQLTDFVRGTGPRALARDQVQRFTEMQPALDKTMPRLARPGRTLRRIASFGERYGSKNQFLSICTINPDFFEVLALLFDRSRFIHDLLKLRPEIFDEVLRPEILRKKKDLPQRLNEMAAVSGPVDRDFANWLWLYVRAEQVRTAIGELLGFVDADHAEADLSALAEATLLHLRSKIWPDDSLLFIALGKLGGRELSFGSDLDVSFLGGDSNDERQAGLIRQLAKTLAGSSGRDAAFELDLRLRPYGEAGSPAPNIAVFHDYFQKSAQSWERQALTRARPISGPPDRVREWEQFIEEDVYGRSLSEMEAGELWTMRLRVQRERDTAQPPERAFKTGSGGLIDVEFALQILQLKHGAKTPSVRTPNTQKGWRELSATGLVQRDVAAQILENHSYLKRLEWFLRRDRNQSVTILPEDPSEQEALAVWLGAPDWDRFWKEHLDRMQNTRIAVTTALSGVVSSTALETSR